MRSTVCGLVNNEVPVDIPMVEKLEETVAIDDDFDDEDDTLEDIVTVVVVDEVIESLDETEVVAKADKKAKK
jgi:hypothetical protein